MANGFDPRIALQVRPPNVGRTFNNILQNIGQLQNLQQQREQAPFRQQILEAQAGQAQQELDLQRFQSVAQGAQEILPDLLTDNPQAALQKLQARRSRLVSQGRPTQDTDQAIQMLQTPEGQLQLTEDAQNVVNQATQRGLLGKQQADPAGVREFEALAVAGQLAPEERAKAARVRLGLDARATNFAEKLQFEIDKAGQTGDIKTKQELERTAGKLGIKLEIDPQIAARTEEAKLPALQRKETIKANTQRIKFLSDDQRKRESSVRKARQFLKPLEEGRAFSGATRSAASFVPGVFTTQAEFDEKFNAFAEVAARQQLKASGEIRPTDADVEGMKRAMFGVGRDEQTNIQLLREFIEDQEALNDELEDLFEARSAGRLDSFNVQQRQQNLQEASDEDLLTF